MAKGFYTGPWPSLVLGLLLDMQGFHGPPGLCLLRSLVLKTSVHQQGSKSHQSCVCVCVCVLGRGNRHLVLKVSLL